MNETFIKQLPHVSKEPVRVERVHPDRLMIEGVLFDGDYFREIGHPDTDVLYMVWKDLDGCVCLTVIRDELEALRFFGAVLPPPPFGHLPQMGERHLGEEYHDEEQTGDENAV